MTQGIRTPDAARAEIVELYQAGVPLKLIAHRAGVAPQTVGRIVRKALPQRRRAMKRAEIERLLGSGLSKVEIARRVGVSKTTVYATQARARR